MYCQDVEDCKQSAVEVAPRGEERRQTILATATELFFERGFNDVTIEEIAHRAHASKQTIYRFFGDRKGLVGEVLLGQLNQAIRPIEDAAAHGTPLERLSNVGAAYQAMAFDLRYLRMYRYLIGSVNQSPELGHAFNELVTDRVIATVEPVVADVLGVDRAIVQTDAFLGALQGKEFNRALAGAHPRATRIAAVLDIVVAGLATQATAPPS